MGSVVLGLLIVLCACRFFVVAFWPSRVTEVERTGMGVPPAATLPMVVFANAVGLMLILGGLAASGALLDPLAVVLGVVMLTSLVLAGWLHLVGRPRFLLPRQTAPEEQAPVPQTVVLHAADGSVSAEWPLSEATLRDAMVQVGATSGAWLLVNGPAQSVVFSRTDGVPGFITGGDEGEIRNENWSRTTSCERMARELHDMLTAEAPPAGAREGT